MAQSNVTLYGLLDTGIESITNQAGSTKTFMPGAGASIPDLYGMKGAEDLGGGLKAIFQLEGSMNLSTGSNSQAVNSNGGMFGRQAYVGLKGDWGTVKLGLQIDPAALGMVETAPDGGSQSFANLPLWINAFLAAGPSSTNTDLSFFDQSSVSYSYSSNGFTGTVLYSIGGGNGSANSHLSLSGMYENGPLSASAGIIRDTAPSGQNGPSEWSLGGGYDVSDALKLSATYFNIKGGATTSANFDIYGVGGAYKISTADTVKVNYYHLGDKVYGGTQKVLSAEYDHALSKRTVLYAEVATAQESNGGFAPNTGSLLDLNGGSFAQGGTVNALVFGIHHSF